MPYHFADLTPAEQAARQQEYAEVIARAQALKHPLVDAALKELQARDQANSLEKIALFDSLQERIRQQDKDLESLLTTTVNSLKKDQAFFKKLNALIQNEIIKTDPSLSWSLKSQKMSHGIPSSEILTQTLKLIEKHGYKILAGKCPAGYGLQRDFYSIWGDNRDIFGNPKATRLQEALTQFYLKTLPTSYSLNDVWGPFNPELRYVDQSTSIYVTHLPQRLSLDDLTITWDHALHSFDSCSHYYADAFTPQGLWFPHNGYNFGGQRGETRYHPSLTKRGITGCYPWGRYLGPEDCSSWLGRLTYASGPTPLQIPRSFSSNHMQARYRQGLQQGVVEPGYLESPDAAALASWQPIKIADPQRDIQPGQMWLERSYFDTTVDPKLETTYGKSGHCLMVLGLVPSTGNLLALGYGRNIPENKEGFALCEVPWLAEENSSKIMFFDIDRPKAPPLLFSPKAVSGFKITEPQSPGNDVAAPKQSSIKNKINSKL